MKNTKFLGFCAFMIVMVLSNEIVRVEGRHLKPNHHGKKRCSKFKVSKSLETNVKGGTVNVNDVSSSSAETNVSKVEYVEDFRPTAPGHSPGVGHSVHD